MPLHAVKELYLVKIIRGLRKMPVQQTLRRENRDLSREHAIFPDMRDSWEQGNWYEQLRSSLQSDLARLRDVLRD